MSSISYTAAALLPATSIVALHALTGPGGLQEGETVLLHNAASTTGQALVQIAQSMNARVLVTGQTQREREILAEVYKIPAECIFPRAGRRVLDVTQGEGVDIIVALAAWGSVAALSS